MTDYYTCSDCQSYIMTCGCPGAAQAIALERSQKRKASKVCSWQAVFQTITGTLTSNLPDACHELDAVEKALALPAGRGRRLLKVTKTITETIWTPDD